MRRLMPGSRLLFALIVLALTVSLFSCAPASPPKIMLQPCMLGNISAQCGSLSVFENRASRQGRKIDLKVAVIKAQDANPAPDPVFYLAGGPGSSAIEDAPYALSVLKSANQHRDLVLVDQRGTGGSNQLTCPRSVEEANYMVPLDDAMLQDLRACLSHLDGDPAAYPTAWAVDDLDDVRAALGYEQINLYGESYGPTVEQVYLQRHAARVRTMTLEGVTLVNVPMFERLPQGSQEALDFLLDRCQADTACQSAYPNLRQELAAVLERVEKQPFELPLVHPKTGQPVTLNRDMLVLGLHGLLIQTPTAVMLPRLVHQMYLGKFDEIAQVIAPVFTAGFPQPVWKIMNMTILCYEDWARMSSTETAKFSDGSYLGYEDVRRFTVPEKVCALMPRPQPEALYQKVTGSTVPVLVISNQADPQNPPENVAGAKQQYPNSLTVIAPGQGHGYLGIPCRDTFISAFIDRGTTDGLDTSCLNAEPLPPFP